MEFKLLLRYLYLDRDTKMQIVKWVAIQTSHL